MHICIYNYNYMCIKELMVQLFLVSLLLYQCSICVHAVKKRPKYEDHTGVWSQKGKKKKWVENMGLYPHYQLGGRDFILFWRPINQVQGGRTHTHTHTHDVRNETSGMRRLIPPLLIPKLLLRHLYFTYLIPSLPFCDTMLLPAE